MHKLYINGISYNLQQRGYNKFTFKISRTYYFVYEKLVFAYYLV